LAPILNNLFAADCIDLVALVVPQTQVDAMTEILSDLADRGEFTDPGGGRAASAVQVVGVDEHTFDSTPQTVRNSIVAKARDVLPSASVALVHQLRHAYAPPELIRQVVDAVRAGAPAAVPVLPCTDTVKRVDEVDVIIDTPDRTTLRVAQAPLGFDVRPGHERSPAGTPPPETLPSGTHTVPGHPAARAIRTSFDLAFAKATPVAETPAAGHPVSSEV
jgi:2-C-methyl-D-erythritol 4-phosphate cytidylyltransferase